MDVQQKLSINLDLRQKFNNFIHKNTNNINKSQKC